MKIFSLTIALFLFNVLVLGQIQSTSTSKTDQTSDLSYSESIPYLPRPEKVANKDKRENKGEKSVQVQHPASTNLTNNFQMPVYVFDKNLDTLANLTKLDFKLFIDDKEHKIESIDKTTSPLNIILLLDVSSSINIDEGKEMNNFALLLAESLIEKHFVKLMKFNEKLATVCDFSNDKEIIKKALKKVKIGGGSSFYDSIEIISKDNSFVSNSPTIVLILTDGVDTTSIKSSFAKSLTHAEKSNLVFFPIYIDTINRQQKTIQSSKSTSNIINSILGQMVITPRTKESLENEYEIGRNYLFDITHLSGGRIFQIETFSNIDQKTFNIVRKLIEPQYFLKFNYDFASNQKTRIQIKVRVSPPNLTVRTFGSRIIN